ncbi:MAG: hypothetical protein HFI93_09065 [Lachnospiraceae bacterium]|nr:hypothetical protein [Lachnospiraceae bacterium]
MYQKLIIEGNTVYEIDEECACRRERERKEKEAEEEKKYKKERGGR